MAEFKIITGVVPTQTVITMDGKSLEGIFRYELTQDVEGFPILTLHIIPTALTVELERTADNVRLYVIADERERLEREVNVPPLNDNEPKVLNVSG